MHLDDAGARPDAGTLERMVAALGHRGPDGRGYFTGEGIGLGHARLGIIDLSTGAQPIHNEDHTVSVVFNGEIFNYPELRSGLKARGHRFATASDTEVLVHLYEELGDSFVELLNGQFAFALWDSVRRRLVLARDRAGILPLYWTRLPASRAGGPGIAFASEVKALLASGLVKAEPDALALDEIWTFWAPVAPRTAFRGIEQLRPGELLVSEGGRTRRTRYWHWSYPALKHHRRADPDQLKDELRTLLEDATTIRLRADVPVGAYLSGGLDSSALVAVIERSQRRVLHTFSVGFEDHALDESAHQRAVAGHLHTEHHARLCTAGEIAAEFPSVVRHAETPVLRSAPAPMRLLSRSVREAGIKVVLTGEGADEVFGGYDIFKEAKVRRFWAREPGSTRRAALLGRLYPYLDFTRGPGSAYAREFFGRGLTDVDDPFYSHQPRWETTASCRVFWSASFAERAGNGARERLRDELPGEFTRWHPFNRAEYLEAQTLLPGYLLSSQGDRMLMSNSVEGRFPYLDHRLIEFANGLDPARKMRGLNEKTLLRNAVRPLLPATIVARSKLPYRAPDAAAFLGSEAPEYVAELTEPGAIARYGYFDPQRVGKLVAKLRRSPEGTVRDNMAFIGILSTQLWHREFIDPGH